MAEDIISPVLAPTAALTPPSAAPAPAPDPLAFLFTNPVLTGGDQAGGDQTSGTDNIYASGAETPPSAVSDTSGEVYQPKKPNYLQQYNTGVGTLEQILKHAYTPDDAETVKKPSPLVKTPTSPDATALTDTANYPDESYYQTRDYLRHGQEFIGENDRMVGNATTFGLQYDDASNDPMDNGVGAFGHNTRDTSLEGAALPISVIKNSIGDYEHDPKIFAAIKNGDYKVAVTNENGVTKLVNIVDAGPAEWTGNAIDLTYRTSHDLGTQGKAKVGYQIIGPDGDTVPVKGYHSDTISRGNWDDHIGPNRKPYEKPEPIPAFTGKTKIEPIPAHQGKTKIEPIPTESETKEKAPEKAPEAGKKQPKFSYEKYAIPVAEGGYLRADGTSDFSQADADKAADKAAGL